MVSEFDAIGKAELFCTVEDAVRYNFCYFVPYVMRKRRIKKADKIVREKDWIKNFLAKDNVIKSMKYAELKYGLQVKSKRFPLKARVDLLVEKEDEVIPVFPKSVNFSDDYNWKLEIVGKVVLLEEFFGEEIRRAFVFLLENREWIELSIFQGEKQNFIELANKMSQKPYITDCESCELKDACSVLPGWI